MIENEAVFRQQNERVRQNFEEIMQLAQESSQEYLVPVDDTALHFYCECSDGNCRKRILLKPSEYQKIHENRRRFVVLPGHETGEVERIVRFGKKYHVVEKVKRPPEKHLSLKPTPIDNV